MVSTVSLTISLPNDKETKTTAYNMGCGLIAIEQYDPTTKRTQTVVLTEMDLVQLRNLIDN